MINTNILIIDNPLGNAKKPDSLSLLHRIVCFCCVLITTYYLLMCIFSICGAIQDMQKFGALGFSHPFGYYLVDNSFPEAICMCLPITSEFLFYVVLYSRAKHMKHPRISSWYLSVMLVLHTIIWLHANSLEIPNSPPFISSDGLGLRYYIFTTITVVQSVVYLILFNMCAHKAMHKHPKSD